MYIDIIILAVVAGFLFFRLREVLGRRTGHQNPSDYFPPRGADARGAGEDGAGEKVIPFPGAEQMQAPDNHDDIAALVDLDSDTGRALQRAKALEPGFDAGHFVEGSRQAYEMILTAYEAGDKATLRPLLGDDVFEAFAAAIDDRAAKELSVDARFVGIRSSVLEDARLDDQTGRIQIDMRFDAEMIVATRDAAGEIVDGDPTEVRRMNDLWTFERRLGDPDPAWLLVETGN